MDDRGAVAVNPSKTNRIVPIPHGTEMYDEMYKWRHSTENLLQSLEEFRRVATRSDKTDQSFAAAVRLAAASLARHEYLQTLVASCPASYDSPPAQARNPNMMDAKPNMEEMAKLEAKVDQTEEAFCENCKETTPHIWKREASFSAVAHYRRYFLECKVCGSEQQVVTISY